MKVEIYSDVVCPWCYIGERRFERALAEFAGTEEVEVVYRAFQLDPDAPDTPFPLKERLRKKFGVLAEDAMRRVTETGAQEGIEFDWDRGVAVNTLTAHRLLRLAEREYGAKVQRELVGKLFDAHFTRGGDVSDHALLSELAASVGMDAKRVRGHLASGEGLEETREELERARRLGVRAVPTFVFDGRYVVEGAQPSSSFVEVLGRVADAA